MKIKVLATLAVLSASLLLASDAFAGKRAIWKCVYIGGDTGWVCNVVGYEVY